MHPQEDLAFGAAGLQLGSAFLASINGKVRSMTSEARSVRPAPLGRMAIANATARRASRGGRLATHNGAVRPLPPPRSYHTGTASGMPAIEARHPPGLSSGMGHEVFTSPTATAGHLGSVQRRVSDRSLKGQEFAGSRGVGFVGSAPAAVTVH